MSVKIVDTIMKYKNEDGTYDIVHPITKSSNIKTTEDITVQAESTIGAYKNGDVITADTSVDDILRNMLKQRVYPNYTAPELYASVSNGTGGSYEEGTKITPSLVAVFTNNDAGALTDIVFTNNNETIQTYNSSPATHTQELVLSGDSNIEAVAHYAQGAVKQDNLGDDYETGRIEAGSMSVNIVKYSTYRKYFWGSDDQTDAPADSASVRGLANSSTSAAANGTSFDVVATEGATRVCFAYPATLNDVTSVVYTAFNDNVTLFFNKSVVSVEGADGFTAIDYKVYTYIPDQPFPSDMTFRVTI